MRLDKQIPPEELAALVKYTEIIEQHGDDMLNLCVELCDNNSGTYNLPGIESVAQILEREFSCLGEPIHRHAVEPLRDIDSNGVLVEIQLGPLLQIIKRPHVRPRVLLCIHMDTVYGIDHPFQKCRTLENGNVNGPGVADAKGGLVVMLHALRAFEASPLAEKIGWEVVINPDEELGSPGSADFLMQRASEADVGLLFEPSLPDGTLVSARKGVGNFCFVVRGKSVHSGREFKKGRNAVVKCCEIMQRVHSLNVTNDVTLNGGRVNGGAALNVVPDLALGRINVRVNTKAHLRLCLLVP